MSMLMQGASAPATRFWAERGPHDWAKVLPTYWAAGAQPHRQSLLAALKQMMPFGSVRELGCCAGTNLKLIRDTFPGVICQGLDVSQEAVIFAQDKFIRDGSVGVYCTDMLMDAPFWEDAEADVVVSCYALAYVAPEDMSALMGHILRSAKVGCVFVEPMIGEPGPVRAPGGLTEWRHDYARLIDHLLATDPRPARMENAGLTQKVELCDGIVMVKFL